MAPNWTAIETKLDFRAAETGGSVHSYRQHLRLVQPAAGPALRGPDKYRLLDLRRRRAQIRARRALGLLNV